MLVSLLLRRQRQVDPGHWERLSRVGWSVCRFQDNEETLFYFMGGKRKKKRKEKSYTVSVCRIVSEILLWLPHTYKLTLEHTHSLDTHITYIV